MVTAASAERALLLLQARRHREAVAAANEVLAVAPNDFEARRVRALAHHDLGALLDAWADVQALLAVGPDKVAAHVTAAVVAWDAAPPGGDERWATMARAHVERARALRPDDTYVLWLATVTARSPADAHQAAERVAAVAPDGRWARLARAEAAVRAERWDVASEALRAELAVNPDDLFTIDWLSRVLARAGRGHRRELVQLLSRTAGSGDRSASTRLSDLVTRSTRVVVPSLAMWFALFTLWIGVREHESVVERPLPEVLFVAIVGGWAALRWWMWRGVWAVVDGLPALGRRRLLQPMFVGGWLAVTGLVLAAVAAAFAGWPPTRAAAEAEQEYVSEQVVRLEEVPVPTVPAPRPPSRLPTVPGRPPMTVPQPTVPPPPLQVPRTTSVSIARFQIENLVQGRRLALASAGVFTVAAAAEAASLLRARSRSSQAGVPVLV